MAKNYDIATIKKAIEDSGGLYTKISARLGCSWNTARTHVEKHEETKLAYSEEVESMLDVAESKLFENVEDNDNQAIFFYLNNKGNGRGYSNRVKTEHSGEIKGGQTGLENKTFDELYQLKYGKKPE